MQQFGRQSLRFPTWRLRWDRPVPEFELGWIANLKLVSSPTLSLLLLCSYLRAYSSGLTTTLDGYPHIQVDIITVTHAMRRNASSSPAQEITIPLN
jgi:hypothetical protein